MYIQHKSAHPRHTVKNYVIGELKRYVPIIAEELNFLKIKNRFFLRMCNRRFKKNRLSHWFSEVKFSSRAKFPGKGMRETEADSLLFRVSKGILKAGIGLNSGEATV